MDADRPSNIQQRFAWNWAGMWTTVFIANLPGAGLLGYGVVGKEGAFGLTAAMGVVFSIGFVICLLGFPVGRSLVWGGLLVAVSQVLPILQILCGVLGMSVWDQLGGRSLMQNGNYTLDSDWRNDRNVGAFVVVLVTAHPLFVISLLLGAAVRWRSGDRPIWFTRRTDPDAEPEPTTESSPGGRGSI